MWKMVKLGDVCELAYGKGLDKSDRLDSNGFPAFGANGIKTQSKVPLYDKPSVIIGRKGSVGQINKVTEPFWALDVTYYTKINENVISLDYLFYVLMTLNLPSFARGVKPGINRNDVYKQTIPLPPLEEQERIVVKLDATFAGIDEAVNTVIAKETEVQNLKASLLSSSLNGYATMEEVFKLGEVFDFKNGRSFKKKEWCESGLPIIRIQNLNDVNALFNYFEGDYDSAIEVNNGDLLFSWSGTVGSSFGPHIWKREKGVLNQHIFKLTKKKEIDTSYAFFCLKNITKLIEDSAVGAVGLRHVTKKNLIEFEIPFPPLEEQKRIVTKLDAAYSKFKNVNESIAKSKANFFALKSAILAQELQLLESEAT